MTSDLVAVFSVPLVLMEGVILPHNLSKVHLPMQCTS